LETLYAARTIQTPAPTDIQQTAPPTLNHYVGQSAVVNQVRVALEAAFADNQRFPHALLTGAPGLGKTLLCQILARETVSELHEVLGRLSPNHLTFTGCSSKLLMGNRFRR